MRSARSAAWRALVALEKGKVPRLDDALVRRGLSRADRALALELARGTERSRLFLDAVLGVIVDRGLPSDPRVRVALRLGAYQLLRLTRIPPYAAVAETVALLRGQRGFANAVLRRLATCVQPRAANPEAPRREAALGDERALVLGVDWLPDPEKQHAAYHATLHGLPVFVVERWQKFYGAQVAEQLAAAADRAPSVTLRVNRRLGDAAALQARLADEDVQTEPLDSPLLLRVSGGGSPFGGATFKEGWFVAQDPTSFAAVEAVGAQPGETVVDLCAGPGTKAAFLAEAVAPEGRVHAYDVSDARRLPIAENARRLGLEENLVVHDDPDALPTADRVMVDVPCSNTGVLARRVEVRRRLREGGWAELIEKQSALLTRALELVRPGGTVVYSTCSIEPEENEELVRAVAAEHRVVREMRTLPDPPAHDGGFHAIVQRAT